MPSQYFGYSIAFLAVAYYNYTKYQAAMADKASPSISNPPEGERLISGGRSSPRSKQEQSKQDDSV